MGAAGIDGAGDIGRGLAGIVDTPVGLVIGAEQAGLRRLGDVVPGRAAGVADGCQQDGAAGRGGQLDDRAFFEIGNIGVEQDGLTGAGRAQIAAHPQAAAGTVDHLFGVEGIDPQVGHPAAHLVLALHGGHHPRVG